jgi:hypothetical protein
MKNELEIRKELAVLQKKTSEGEPYSEIKRVGILAAIHVLKWTIEETEFPLDF